LSRLAIFDLDGTLVDSAPDIQSALGRLMASQGRPGFTRAETIAMVGDGIPTLFRRACAARGLAPDPALLAAFTDDYTAHASDETRPFAGAEAVLDALAAAGWRLGLCTNKPAAPTAVLLRGLGLADRFAAVLGGDSLPVRKPDGGHVLGVIAAAGGDPARAAMIGDHHNDVLAAQAAGIPAIFCAWGYGTLDMAHGAPVAGSIGEVPALLERLVRAGAAS
jgi:phosphoglycolate phosphatase